MAGLDDWPSLTTPQLRHRRNLRGSLGLVRTGGYLRLTRDALFESSSQAAAVMIGHSANGPHQWIAADGRRYNMVPGAGSRSATVCSMSGAVSSRPAYEPLSLAGLAGLMAGADKQRRWRLVAEFLEDYRHEPAGARPGLVAEEPPGTGDERWDVFLAALAEHVAARNGRAGPRWAETRSLRRLWFPFATPAARVDALVHAPAAFRRRGVYVAAQELEVA
jgi:hypothetical protein